jgi:hypothetical protein
MEVTSVTVRMSVILTNQVEGGHCRHDGHIIKITETLDDIRLYYGERKMILNENDSRAIPSS